MSAEIETLGQAEAEIHSTSIDQVHFHEVGAVDAMVDIVCAAVGAESLAVEEWVCSPLNVGGGTVKCAHGTLPVPAPATLKLLRDAPVYSSGPQVELVTPTGARLVTRLARAELGQYRIVKRAKFVVNLTAGELTAYLDDVCAMTAGIEGAATDPHGVPTAGGGA